MNKSKISIIIPIYNVEPYLKKCIDSIILQSYSNLEIILVDDGSPDNCGNMCDDYASKDSRIVVIHKQNGGLSSARNAGINIAKGDYLMFVDSDDWVEKDFCETALKKKKKKKVDCLAFGYFKHENNIVIPKFTDHPRYLLAEEAIRSIVNLDDIIYNFAVNKIYSKKVFKDIRFPVGRLFEDQGTTYRIFDYVGKIYVSNSPLYHYISRSGSIMNQKYKPKAINDKFDLWVERLHFIKNNYPSVYNDQLLQIVKFTIEALRVLRWNKDVVLRKKIEFFLKDNKEKIKSLNIKSNFLSLFYNFYPGYVIYMKLPQTR